MIRRLKDLSTATYEQIGFENGMPKVERYWLHDEAPVAITTFEPDWSFWAGTLPNGRHVEAYGAVVYDATTATEVYASAIVY